ncbi:MAG: hypothetical protein ACXVCP_09295 [Bdellovibrio sp.]
MNSQDFLTLNLVGAGAFIVWYVVARGGTRKPAQLNLKAKDSDPPLIVNPVSEPSESKIKLECVTHPDLVNVKPKNLNVMFNYNGHSWDAYEVLGVPAGSSIKTVTEAYQKAVVKNSKSSLDFLETAYKAILNKVS